jgi:hypothetical protein
MASLPTSTSTMKVNGAPTACSLDHWSTVENRQGYRRERSEIGVYGEKMRVAPFMHVS